MGFELWIIYVLVCLIPVISPGPAIFLTIKNSIKHGAKPTIHSATGNAFGLVILGYAIAFGLGALMDASALLFNCVKYIGAAYLIYLGIKIWRDQSLGVAQSQIADDKMPAYKLFFEGFIISVTNPKAMAVLAAIFPSFLTQPELLLLQASILSFTYAGLCFFNHMILIVFAKNVQSKLNTGNNLAIFRRALGGTFMGFGVALGAISQKN